MGKKRGNGEGTIRQLPSGRWVWIAMEGRRVDGTPNYVRLHADTRKGLAEVIDDYKRSKKDGATGKRSALFKLFSDGWWERYKRNLRISTQDSSAFVLRKLQMYWEDTPLDQITASAVYDMLIHFSVDMHLSDSYMTKLRGMMHQIMHAAEADDLIRRNPVPYVVYRPHAQQCKQTLHKKDAFTPQEIAAVCAAPASKIRDTLMIMIGVGLRPQEVLALRGRDITPDGRNIKVEKAVNMEHAKPVIGLTKNESSVRTVPVPSAIRPIVEKYIAYDEHLIWESDCKKGQPINPSAFRKQMKKFCEETGIRPLTPHCGRHTCITQLRAHKVDAEVVKAIVGHTRGDVTEGYNHIPREVLEGAMESLNDLFRFVQKQKTDPKRSA